MEASRKLLEAFETFGRENGILVKVTQSSIEDYGDQTQEDE